MESHEPNYPALISIMWVLKKIGWGVFVLAVIIGIAISLTDGSPLPLLVSIIVGAMILLICLASAETIKVLVDIEGHLRKMAYPPYESIKL